MVAQTIALSLYILGCVIFYDFTMLMEELGGIRETSASSKFIVCLMWPVIAVVVLIKTRKVRNG